MKLSNTLSSLLLIPSAIYAVEFDDPVQIMAGDKALAVESPGYASPCFADMDGDGTKELLVGQFNDGKIKVYTQIGDHRFDNGGWLKYKDEVMTVPGIW
ncbi:MAG: hypothetical protein HRU46_01955 [Verrucomicrobiales bacterium]|nr:hypothetical protein [Verrucomicrobiales bacterium]